MSEAQKQSIMREVLEEHISPNELARKYSIPAYAIRDWIKKAGHTLPKSYKRFALLTKLKTDTITKTEMVNS